MTKANVENNITPFQDEDGHLTKRDTDKAEVFNTSSAWMMDHRSLSALSWKTTVARTINSQLTLVWDLLLQQDPSRSVEPDGVCLRILSC